MIDNPVSWIVLTIIVLWAGVRFLVNYANAHTKIEKKIDYDIDLIFSD